MVLNNELLRDTAMDVTKKLFAYLICLFFVFFKLRVFLHNTAVKYKN